MKNVKIIMLNKHAVYLLEQRSDVVYLSHSQQVFNYS